MRQVRTQAIATKLAQRQIQTYLKSRSLVNDFPEATVIQAPASLAICHGSIVADTGLMSRTSFSMNI